MRALNSHAMSIATALEELESSPELLDHVEHLNRVVEEEQRRREEFINRLDEDTKAEFINGQVVVHSPARLAHIRATGNITFLLTAYCRTRALGEVTTEKALIHCRRNDYEPDVCFFSQAKCEGWKGDKLLFPPPDLVVEVLSPSTERNDRTVKLRDYARHEVAEYWIVDADARTVEQHTRPGKAGYETVARLDGGDPLVSVIVPGFTVPVAAFFDAQENQRTLRELLEQL